MGVFTRLKDIINSNLNAMLDAAEDPEKLIRLMVQEMEDTLVEVKATSELVIDEFQKVIAIEKAAAENLRLAEEARQARDELA